MNSFQEEIMGKIAAIAPFYLVGGKVRDQLLGRPNQDVDGVAAMALDELERYLRERGYHPWKIGAKHQTLSLFRRGQRIDINAFDGDLEADARRRDFTINAIFQDARTGELIDPLRGRRDLAEKILRACGNPRERFREDPVRILRMVRFRIQYGLDIEEKTFKAAQSLLPELKEAAPERTSEELGRILTSADPAAGMRLLDELGYLTMYLPELAGLQGRTLSRDSAHPEDAWEHTLQVLAHTPPRLILRLAALLHELGKWEATGGESEEREKWPAASGRLARRVLARFRFAMVLGKTGAGGEKDLLWLIENQLNGARDWLAEFRGAGRIGQPDSKLRRFVWAKGWDGRSYRLKRVEQLLELWLADFQGGKKGAPKEEEVFNVLLAKLHQANNMVHQRHRELTWAELAGFAREHKLTGRAWGEFKERLRTKRVVSVEEIPLTAELLEKEYRDFCENP